MNEKTESESEILNRFETEVKKLSVSNLDIANKTGFSAQTITNILRKRNLPGALLLSEIKKIYPQFDLEYVLVGLRNENNSLDLVKAEFERFKKAMQQIL